MRLLLFCLLCSCTCCAQQWQELPAFPEPGRDDAVGFSLGEYIYLTTGNHGGFSESNRTFRLKNDFILWEEVSSFPGIPRQYSAAFSLNGKGFVVGGISEDGVALDDFWCYDPAVDTWTQLADFPGIAHWGASATSYSTMAFLAGGTDGNTVLNQLWMYVDDTWFALPHLPGTGSRDAALVAIPNRLIYTGGFRISPLECITDTYIFDLGTQNWSTGTPLPADENSYISGTVLNQQALIAGGWSCAGNYTNNTWLTDGEQWHALPDLPSLNIRGMSACTVNGQACFFSGLLENGQRSTQTLQFGDAFQLEDCMIYPNPSNGSVTISAPLNSRLRIFSTTGEKVEETVISASVVTLNTPLSEGVYLAEFLLNGERKTEKLIIHAQP